MHLTGKARSDLEWQDFRQVGEVPRSSKEMPNGTQNINLGDMYYLYKYVEISIPWGCHLVWVWVFSVEQNSAKLNSSAIRHIVQIYLFIFVWHWTGDSISESHTFSISICWHWQSPLAAPLSTEDR